MKNPGVDKYLMQGCMRCKYGNTPDCKVHIWIDEIIKLREIVLECGLKEEVKWGVPCYTYNGKNVVLVSAFKKSATLSFFKGVLINDPEKKLSKPGENSQSSRVYNFTSIEEIKEARADIVRFVHEAIEIEKKGLVVPFKKNPEPIPEELKLIFAQNHDLENAFYALTPGRQRGYVIYFSAPKQSKTRFSRIEKYIPKILAGKGFHDRT